jgi:hypothetical protein
VSPRVLEDSVHPRLRSGASTRPLNFTVRQHMRHATVLLFAVLILAACASPTATKQAPPPAAPFSVVRYAELPLSEYQTQVMNEATKLSFACRMFRNLYGRWPNDLAEIEAKTEGINFSVFLGKAVVTPLPDDSERIQIFDGFNTREVKAVPVDLGVTDAKREAAKAPGFKIKV